MVKIMPTLKLLEEKKSEEEKRMRAKVKKAAETEHACYEANKIPVEREESILGNCYQECFAVQLGTCPISL